MKTKITKLKWSKNLTLSQWSLERKKIEGLDNHDIVRIGASDVSVCTGSNKWKCPQRLFYHLTGYHSGFFITKKTVAGHLEESNIVQHFEAWNPDNEQQYLIDVGDKVRHRKLNKANYFLLNSDYPNSFVSLDYTVAKFKTDLEQNISDYGIPNIRCISSLDKSSIEITVSFEGFEEVYKVPICNSSTYLDYDGVAFLEDLQDAFFKDGEGVDISYSIMNANTPRKLTKLLNKYLKELPLIECTQFSPITGEKYPNGMPVELKTAEGFYYKMWTDGLTQPYLEQIQYQMLLTEQPMALLLVFVDKEDLKVKEVYADANLQQHILAKVNEFADKVKVGKMALQGMKDAEAEGDRETYEAFCNIFESVTPPSIGSDDNVELMQEIYADAIDADVNIKQGDEQDYYNIGQYLKCTKVINNIEDYKKLIKTKLLKSCAEWEGIEVGDRKLTNRRATQLKKAYFSCKQTN